VNTPQYFPHLKGDGIKQGITKVLWFQRAYILSLFHVFFNFNFLKFGNIGKEKKINDIWVFNLLYY